MKTLTEFSSAVLKTALKAKQELTTAGKTAEELPTALGEVLKLEGEKLTFVLAATELVERKLEDLKRVVVMKLNEGEKPPGGAVQKGEHCFSAEYYPSLNPPKAARGADRDPRDKGRGGRGAKSDRKGGKNGRDGARGPGRDSRGPARDSGRPASADGAAASTEPRPARRPPRQRPPRREDPATPPKPAGWVVKPKSDTPDSPQAAVHTATSPAPTGAAAENSGTEKV